MPRTLAAGKTKFTILTTAPADPTAPTATELNAGIDLSLKVLAADFNWTPTDSEKVNEQALGEDDTANAFGSSNYSLGFTLFRYYLDAGGIDTSADAGFTAVKSKGTTLWGYIRKSDSAASDAWVAGDEFPLGGEFTVDSPQDPGQAGWLKYRVPCEAQSMTQFGTVG